MATRPTPPWGYHVCATTPAFVTLSSKEGGDASYADWAVWEYIGDDDDFIYYRYMSVDGKDEFWAFPDEVDCENASHAATPSGNAAKVKEVQSRLNTQWKPSPLLAVDGSWGPMTCKAAYDFQVAKTGYKGGSLLGPFFVALGLPEVWTSHFVNACAAWHGDVPGPTPKPDVPEPTTPFPWSKVLMGAAGGSLVGLAGKKTVLKKSKLRTWQVGVAGAVIGALGGYVAAKMLEP